MTSLEQNEHKKRAEQLPLSNSTIANLIKNSNCFYSIPNLSRLQHKLGGKKHVYRSIPD